MTLIQILTICIKPFKKAVTYVKFKRLIRTKSRSVIVTYVNFRASNKGLAYML